MQGSVSSGRNSQDAGSSTDVKYWTIIEKPFKRGSHSKEASVPSTRVKNISFTTRVVLMSLPQGFLASFFSYFGYSSHASLPSYSPHSAFSSSQKHQDDQREASLGLHRH